MNVLVMISYIHIYIYIYIYVYMKCVLTNDFIRSASLDSVHRRVGLGGATTSNTWLKPKAPTCESDPSSLPCSEQ